MAGEIVHIEFPSKDMDRAQRFWSGLFGWSFGADMPGMAYRMAPTGEGTGAALLGTQDGPGHPIYYYATDDIEASSSAVRELGGTASEKTPGSDPRLVRGVRGQRGQRVPPLAGRPGRRLTLALGRR